MRLLWVLLDLSILLFDSFILISGSCIIPLANLSWTFYSDNVSGRASVPGNIYHDLAANDLLNCSLLSDDCDLQSRWVSRLTWTYETTFPQPSTCDLEGSSVFLIAKGIDTVSSITLNGFDIGKTDNMFIEYKFVIPPHLLIESNTLKIQFTSPISYASDRFYDYLLHHRLSVPQFCPLPTQHGECHVNFIRKMQASFSWDWGPSFPSVGVWKNIYLQVVKSTHFKTFTVTPVMIDNQWHVETEAFLEAPESHTPDEIQLRYLLDDDLLHTLDFTTEEMGYQTAPSKFGYREIRLKTLIKVTRDIQVWWPAGSVSSSYNIPIAKLYKFTVKFSEKDNKEKELTKKIGFRTVELIQDPVTNTSATFYFKINGKEMFMRGSNWIPANILPTHNSTRVRYLLESARDANMNILRVWGGGIYESDSFYNSADELGLFIWHDLMFACSLYPGQDQEFLSSVKVEISQQVRRLKSHPSILLWSGNNEIEQAIAGNWYPEVLFAEERFKQDYRRLFIDTIAPILAKEDATRIYLPSSPSNGPETAASNWTSSTPNGNAYGDVHFYQDNDDSWDQSTYPSAHFVSEYGYESFPAYESWLTSITDHDCLIYPPEDCIKHRQHKLRGTTRIVDQMRNHFPVKFDESLDFSHFIYLTQIDQAMSIKTESEFYRMNRQLSYAKGEGKTMGALYWQLNDVWVAPTWSSIDYTGRWKLLHNYAKKFFAPVLITPVSQGGGRFAIHATNDLIHSVNISTQVLTFNLTSFKPIGGVKINATLEASSSTVIRKLKSASELVVTRTRLEGGKLTQQDKSDNFLLLRDLKKLSLEPGCNVRVESVTKVSKGYKVNVASDSICLFVYLYVSDPHAWGIFSDNGFIMSEPLKSITFTPKCCDDVDFSRLIRVKALNN